MPIQLILALDHHNLVDSHHSMKSNTSQKRVAVVQPVLVPGGGTEAVTAWTIEALKEEFDVSLITYSEVTGDALNRYYGTDLKDAEFSTVQPALPPLLKRTKRFLLLKDHLMIRYCKSARKRFDLFISVGGAMDFGSRSIQYMALAPGSTLVKVLARDPSMPAAYHVFKRTFMRLAELISGSSQDRLLQNTTLVTSRWAGKLIERLYGFADYEVVYPPVNLPSAIGAWEPREDGFLCIARISPEKQIEQAIEILRRVREKGFSLSLRIVGREDDPSYGERIRLLCQENGSWAVLEGEMSREQLHSMMDRSKYGINAASDEPFGIAVAEMVSAGCIVFVPDSGGQTEIVNDPRLIFSSIQDAVDKIVNVLDSETLQQSMRDTLSHQDAAFSTQAFCGSMRNVVQQFFAGA